MAFLRQFARDAGATAETLTVELVQQVRDRTALSGQSLAESLVGSVADNAPLAGPATLFVSHAQQCSFTKMLDALDEFVARERLESTATFFWVDAFSIRQSDVANDIAQIGAIERQIGKVVMVLDPWDKPRCLTRVWCLYEVVHCCIVKSDTFLKFTMAPNEWGLFKRAVASDPSAVERLVQFDARAAEATVEDDRKMIMRLIESQFHVEAATVVRIDPSGDHIDRFNRSLRRTLSATLTDVVNGMVGCDKCKEALPAVNKAARVGLDDEATPSPVATAR